MSDLAERLADVVVPRTGWDRDEFVAEVSAALQVEESALVAEREAREGQVTELRNEAIGLHRALRKETERAEQAEEALRACQVLLHRWSQHDLPTAEEKDAYQAALSGLPASLSAVPAQKEEEPRADHPTDEDLRRAEEVAREEGWS